MELNSIEAIKNAVQSGLGAAFVSVSAISKELELDFDEPYISIVEIDNNSTFVANKTKTFDE